MTEINAASTEMEEHTKRTRSRLGCFTCRKRKKRCDEARPLCGPCTRLFLECGYPPPGEERKNKKRKSHSQTKESRTSSNTSSSNLTPESTQDRRQKFLSTAPAQTPHYHSPVPQAPTISQIAASNQASQGQDDPENSRVGHAVSHNDQSPKPVLEESQYDILSPMFRFEDVFSDGPSFAAMPDFLPSQLVFDDSVSTHSMLTRLSERYPALDPNAVRLFTYFCDTQSQLMSVSPQNHFKGIFAEMAIKNESVLYALLSWAAFHNSEAMGGGDIGDNLGLRFLTRAIKLVSDHSRYEFTATLAALLLIASAHICSGDMRNWRQYLETAANLIKQQGTAGIDFNNEEQYWLLKNFTYHDILAFGNRKRPLLLPKELHNQILKYKSDVLPDTLCACCQPIFIILATINDFCREIHEENVTVDVIQQKADDMLAQLDFCSPNRELLLPLSYMDAKEQLNLFKLFQQLARVVVHNLILRLNAACIPMQLMNAILLQNMESVIGTRGEGATIFPLFIAAITACSSEARTKVMLWLDTMYERHSARNIARARALIREVWARDEQGSKHVDWNHLAELKGWNLSFA